MFRPFNFIQRIKQAFFMWLIRLLSTSNQRFMPLIKQSAFYHQCNPQKLHPANDNQYDGSIQR
ncbi:hypothetical protein [Candidatus Berkiella aquae]|uniref:Uncharacterized protein n=1 Tax=Candidatus Berkiella aquae TaxID=295108 RepID=A0A0Q9YI80_9GAMM|nr:hypothetical protein [Candidatus Berkiella aquae]MCS5711703.1 hypothetical protein [Candidatus Berkiella aquae]